VHAAMLRSARSNGNGCDAESDFRQGAAMTVGT
jgi:hypothetical protein